MPTLAFRLPWPPSVNRYWRRNPKGRGMFISAQGRAFREEVAEIVGKITTLSGEAEVEILACPPDRRRRDLDNILKATLDALESAGVVEDDAQFKRILVEQGGLDRAGGGHLEVLIRRRTASAA